MQNTNFQGHQPFGSGEEIFLRFLPYMGMVAILVMWHGPFEQKNYEIWLTGQAVSEEKMFKECGRRMTTEAYLYYKLTSEP